MPSHSRTNSSSPKPLFVILGALLAISAVAWFIGKLNQPLTPAFMAEEMNKSLSLPKDMGDGLRLDSITASGNDVVFTATMTDIPHGPYPPEAISMLEQASLSDACREMNAKPEIKARMNEHGFAILKQFRDASGGMVVSHRITPISCP